MSTIESFEISISQLGRTRTVWVYLPTNYDEQSHHPVIYMHDGQNIFFDHLAAYGKAWHANNTMDELYQLTGQSAIVVGVECNDQRRLSEYSPWKASLPMEGFSECNRGGEGDAYAEFFATNLTNEICSRYKVDSRRIATAVIGSSMGGLISLYLGLKHQHLYETMGLLSPFTPFNERALNAFLNKTPQQLSQHALVYCGGKEDISVSAKVMLDASTRLYHKLARRQICTELLFNSEFYHDEKAWDVVFKKFAKDFLSRYYSQCK